jgi:Rab GDP dissociation inhibitor
MADGKDYKGDDNEDGEEVQAKKEFSWMPSGCEPLADGEYDAIVLGTGLTECIISGLLSVQGKRVLHLDRNNYYGAETASLSLQNLFQKFRDGNPPAALGPSRDWNVDLVPKFIMACGKLVKILLHSKVTRYLEFRSVDGSYVFKDGKVQKVPATPSEALNSALMGFFEKRKFRNFLIFVQNYEKDKPATYLKGKSMDRMTTRQLYEEFGLDVNTQAFTGHAMALHRDDDYLNEPAAATVEAIQLYAFSLERYGKSPYIYPLFGLGGMPEGFSRLCAIHGGTFMLNKGIDEILFDRETGKAWGVRAGEEVAKAAMVIGDPSYFAPDKTRSIGRVVRSICILDHPIAGTDNAESVQIIIPASQVRRRNDIYVCMVSYAHNVASPGKYIAIVSTTVETENPIGELSSGFNLLGKILERFDSVSELYEAVSDGKADNCYISKSYDATSHFETAANDVLSLYERVTGEILDMNISADMEEEN